MSPVTKAHTAGTHRVIPPDETAANARGLMGKLRITRIADVTGLDTIGIPVIMAVRPNARSLSVAQGKGATLSAAIASGLMEAIESYHAEQITLPLKLACYDDLCHDHSIIALDALPRYAGCVLHGAARILWIAGRHLKSGEERWLPYETVHTDYTVPLPPGSGIFLSSSSGLASGNHPFEAILHGLCELIERDAVTMWAHRLPEDQARTRLDLTTVDDEHCRGLLDKYERAGVAVSVWDVTSDIGVATFKCTICDEQPNPQRPIGPMGGYGCHPARAVALSRALTEAAQSRLTTIAGARDDMQHHRLEPAAYEQAHADFHARRTEAGDHRRFDDMPDVQHDDLGPDVDYVIERLRQAGLEEPVAVDLTKPELGVPVVRVVVPGLEPLFDLPGYQPGKRVLELLHSSPELWHKHFRVVKAPDSPEGADPDSPGGDE